MEQKTILYDEHLKLGARMAPFGGYLMPMQYEGIRKEHEAVREGVGIFDCSHMGEFRFTGEAAGLFLDWLLTNPMSTLRSGRARYSPMCYEDGGTVDDLLVYRDDEGYWMVVNAANREKDASWIEAQLERFEDRADVQFRDHSEEISLIAIQGPGSRALLEALCEASEPGLKSELPTKYYRFTPRVRLFGHDVLISRTGYTGEYGFEIYGSGDAILDLWRRALALGAVPCGLGARDTLRLEAGFPLYGHELSPEIRPDEAGLSFAIKLDRDPFIGQEALRQPAERELLHLKVEGRGIIRADQPVLVGDEEVGFVTSGTQGPTVGCGIGMALVRKDRPDGAWSVDVRGRKIPVSIVEGAFVEK